MTTQTEPTPSQRGLRSLWPRRTTFRVGKTRRQRQEQFEQQRTVLLLTLVATVVFGALLIYLNWQSAGSTKTVSCINFPEYCVPLVGGGSGSDANLLKNESSSVRALDAESSAVPGVVRGITDGFRPFIGNPDAPVHLVVLSDYACSHCQDYHKYDLKRITNDFMLTGQATLELAMLTGTGGMFSETASQAMLCAGEQGALWEMNDEMFRLVNAMNPDRAFSLDQIRLSAENMGLDSGELVRCISSGRYLGTMANYRAFANDNGVTGTPTVLVRYGDSSQWSRVTRNYETIRSLVSAANAQ